MKNYILVVDDSPTVRAAAQFALNEAGYDVKTADDGVDGLKKLQMIHDEGSKTDMIISDVNMPNMDGITFTKEVKKSLFKEIPILMLTTESQASKKEAGKAAGAVGWFTKPFLPNQLVEVIKKFVESPKKTSVVHTKLELKEHLDKLLQIFCNEALVRIAKIEEDLSELEKQSDNDELVESIFSEVHNLKGWSGFAGCINIPGFSHVVENVLKKAKKKEVMVTDELILVFSCAINTIKKMIESIINGEDDDISKRDMKDIKEYLQCYL